MPAVSGPLLPLCFVCICAHTHTHACTHSRFSTSVATERKIGRGPATASHCSHVPRPRGLFQFICSIETKTEHQS